MGLLGGGRASWAAAVSAHQGGTEDAPPGTYEAFTAALETGAEYVEFDIRRTADAEFVVFHEAAAGGGRAIADTRYRTLCELAGYEVPRALDVMRLIAGKAMGHLDLKEPGSEDQIIRHALEILGPGNFLATTPDEASAALITCRFPEVLVALTVGRGLASLPALKRLSVLRQDFYPLARIHASGADWAAINYRLGLAGVLRQCHRQRIRAIVWTANSDAMIARLLADPRVDVVVTDRPRRAVALREQMIRSAR